MARLLPGSRGGEPALHSTRIEKVPASPLQGIVGLASMCDWQLLPDPSNRSGQAGPCEARGFVLAKRRSPPRSIFVSMRGCSQDGAAVLAAVASCILPQLTAPVVLFSGSEDCTLPTEVNARLAPHGLETKRAIQLLCSSPLVERWLVENLVAPHPPKMVPLPLGFNPKECASRYEEPVCGELWGAVRAAAQAPLRHRPLKMLCVHRGARSASATNSSQFDLRKRVSAHCKPGGAWAHLVHRPRRVSCAGRGRCVEPGERMRHADMLATMARDVSFVLCVHGGGQDPAPKAFEALAAGAIPIVERSALDKAYAMLPVAFVDDFEPHQITEERLRYWRAALAPRLLDPAVLPRRLTLDYWWRWATDGTVAAAGSAPRTAPTRLKSPAASGMSSRLVEPLAFIHIPKTAGTSIEDVALRARRQWGRHVRGWPGGDCPWGRLCSASPAAGPRCNASACDGTWQPCSPWHMPPSMFSSHGTPAPAYAPPANRTFCVVRNPYDRAVSQIEMELRPERLSCEQVRAALDQRVRRKMARLRDDAMSTTNDCHWLPQWAYVDGATRADADGAQCGIVLRFERLPEGEFERVVRQRLPASGLRRLKKRKLAGNCSLGLAHLSAASKKLIAQVYARDFKRFGYPT